MREPKREDWQALLDYSRAPIEDATEDQITNATAYFLDQLTQYQASHEVNPEDPRSVAVLAVLLSGFYDCMHEQFRRNDGMHMDWRPALAAIAKRHGARLT
jgi:hypothetical protein